MLEQIAVHFFWIPVNHVWKSVTDYFVKLLMQHNWSWSYWYLLLTPLRKASFVSTWLHCMSVKLKSQLSQIMRTAIKITGPIKLGFPSGDFW